MRYEKLLDLYKYLSTGDVSRSELESYADKYKNESGILKEICQHPKVIGKLLKKITQEENLLVCWRVLPVVQNSVYDDRGV